MGNVRDMPSFMQQLTKLAKSPQGKKLVNKAQQIANDPKTKEQVEKAKVKLAEMRSGGSTGGSAGATDPTGTTGATETTGSTRETTGSAASTRDDRLGR